MRIQIGFILAARYVYIKPMVYICTSIFKKSTCIMCIYTCELFFVGCVFKKYHQKKDIIFRKQWLEPCWEHGNPGTGGTHR